MITRLFDTTYAVLFAVVELLFVVGMAMALVAFGGVLGAWAWYEIMSVLP